MSLHAKPALQLKSLLSFWTGQRHIWLGMHKPYRLFKWAPGTFTSSRLQSDGEWLDKVESLGKAESLGEFNSADAAREKASELLARERNSIFLICDAELVIAHEVFDKVAQEELARQRERGDVRAKFAIASIVVVISYVLLWNHDLLALTPSGIAIALAVPVVCYVVTITFNPVETAVALGILLVLLVLSLEAAAKLRKRKAHARSDMSAEAGRGESYCRPLRGWELLINFLPMDYWPYRPKKRHCDLRSCRSGTDGAR